MGEEVVHIVEVAMAGVDELGVITPVLHQRSPGKEIFIVGAFDHGGTGQRRHGKIDSLQSAYRPGSRCVEVGEKQRLMRQSVEVWCQAGLSAERLEVFTAHALLYQDNDVKLFLISRMVDLTGNSHGNPRL